ncbi:hypothetical protein [Fodinibius sediminis]|uniref:HTTM domain-containing protein n=1 Tax=Fodinibius sediminis TaxID=1214077 RepID=A0A521B6U1_9BACT|nr:hypothetical protein [Fodinibius sediminis]SMO42818.1 hypothetical protein SAMN06265218_102244 [Fodinibius sediminis]
MDRLFDNLFNLEVPESTGTKIQLRAFELFTVVYTLIYTWEWAFYVPRLSDIVLPLGLANYIDVKIFFGELATINAIVITLACLIPFFFKRQRWLYFLAFILFHIQYVSRFSQGEIPHSANFVGFSLMGLGIAALFIRDIKKSLPFAFGFTLFFIGLGYTSAAISKLVATGITWVDGQHLWLWIGEKSIDILSKTGEFQLNWLQELAISSRMIATLILTFGLVTEFMGFCIWYRRWRPYITLALIGMHIGIDLTMNIFFKTFTIQLIIMGFPWNRYINALIHRRISFSGKPLRRYLLY